MRAAKNRRSDDGTGNSGGSARNKTTRSLQSIAKTLARLDEAMLAMNQNTIHTDEVVRSVMGRVKCHGKAKENLDFRMNTFRNGAQVDTTSFNDSFSNFDFGCSSLPVTVCHRPGSHQSPTSSGANTYPKIHYSDTCNSSPRNFPPLQSSKSATCFGLVYPFLFNSASFPDRECSPCKHVSLPGVSPRRDRVEKRVCPVRKYCQNPCREGDPPIGPVCTCMKRFHRLSRKLWMAALNGTPSYVRCLLKSGANVNYKSEGGWTPLHRAARRAHEGVLHDLLKHGADVSATNDAGSTALHVAAYHDYSGRCVALLLSKGADVHKRNRTGRTPLHWAAECGNKAAVRALRLAGASTAAKDNAGRTPSVLAKTPSIRRLLRQCYRRNFSYLPCLLIDK